MPAQLGEGESVNSSKLLGVLTASVAGMLILSGCSSEPDRQAAVAESAPTLPIVALPPMQETLVMSVDQIGQFETFPDDKEYVVESSNEEVVSVFMGYTDDSGVSINGPGLLAVGVGMADVTVYDPDFVGDPFERFRVSVTEAEPVGIEVESAEPTPDPSESLVTVLDTKMTLTNNSGSTRVLQLGSGCVRPEELVPTFIADGASNTTVGWCALRESDVSGAWTVGSLWSGYSQVKFFAGNPTTGYPWMEVDGVRHKFSENETCYFQAQGEIFEASRKTDLTGAKDMRLTWVKSSTAKKC